jgi:hypothetical protein
MNPLSAHGNGAPCLVGFNFCRFNSIKPSTFWTFQRGLGTIVQEEAQDLSEGKTGVSKSY